MTSRSPLKIAALLLIAASTLTLQGCFTLAAAGLGATALAVDDRRPFGLYVEDENIELKARARLFNDFKDTHVNVTSFNLSVMLTGEVPNEQMKKDVEAMARGIPSVKNVTNELVVGGNSSYTSRGSDTFITTSVKTRFLNNKIFSANHIKVVTEAGTVFLMGIVTKEEGDAAADIARNTSGVSRVVKVFEYVDQVPKR
jgi:osmotically-inducible protein OsmY